MIDYNVGGDGIATITWNVADQPMNVMNQASMAAFDSAVREALGDDKVRGVIIASARREFIVGADLQMMLGFDDPAELQALFTELHAELRRIETGGKPFAAAINGHALGGGYELALCCHYRVAAEAPRLKIGLPEAKVGLLPGGGGTQRLPRLIGIREALPLMLEGRELDQERALALGMVDRLVPADQLLAEARHWLLEEGPANVVKPWDRKGFRIPGGAVQSPAGQQTFIAGNAMLHARTWGNYPAQRNIMSCVYEGCQVDIDTGLKIETRYLVNTASSKEARNLIRLFFSTAEANKLARRPAGVAPAVFGKVGVLGAGMMGSGIAYVTAMAGMHVALLDTGLDLAERGKGYAEQILRERAERRRIEDADVQVVLDRITPTADYAALDGAELVIEAVFEDRAVKADVTAKAEAVIPESAIFASNTSTLPITSLAEASARPRNFIGLHFFSPVEKMPLVEVIRGRETSDKTLARAMDYVKAIGKTPIVVNDSRGFFTSRVFATYVREGMTMVAEGVKPALIENAGRFAGMPMGPLAVADEVSLELMHQIGQQTRKALGEAYIELPADAVLKGMVETLGRVGKKAGKGFYDYGGPEGKRLWPELAQHFPLAAEQPKVDQVIERLMFIQSVEAARCLESGVVTDPRDADVGSILGWGFAPFRGGVISQIDMTGVREFVERCDRLAERHGVRFRPPRLLRDMAAEGRSFYPESRKAA